MSSLFKPGTINGMVMPNRFVRSATYEGMATDDGAVTPKLNEVMTALAEGGVGMIISSHAYIRPEGQAGPWQLGVYKDELMDGLKEMAEIVHETDSKLVMQIAHAGHLAFRKPSGPVPWVVSNFDGLSKEPCHEMTAADIQALITSFAEAAERAKTAEFDGVQIHAAHGYLLNQFLSPFTNRRSDEFGGDVKNRARIHMAVFRAIRAAVGDDYPVMIKINSRDFFENGTELTDSIQAMKMLTEAGLDAVEISGGTFKSGKLIPSRLGIGSEDKEAYFREEARAFKKELDIPVILVGGMRSPEVAEKILEDGTADYISMCRPFIREPDLVSRWQSGDRRPAKCVSDNLCFKPLRKGDGVYCLTAERASRP